MSDIKERLNSQALRIGPGDLCADLMIAAGTITELEDQRDELLEKLKWYNEVLKAEALKAIAKAKGAE